MTGYRLSLVVLLALGLGSACTSVPVATGSLNQPAAAPEMPRCPASGSACQALFTGEPERLAPQSPAERFESRINRIREALKGLQETGDQFNEPDLRKKIIEAFSEEDVRSMSLQLQALQSMYAEIYKEKGKNKKLQLIEEQREGVETFEGALGAYMRAQELLKRTYQSKSLPEKVHQAIGMRSGPQAEEKLLKELRRLGWDTNPMKNLDELSAQVKRLKFDDVQEDKLVYVRAMRERVEDMIKKVKKTKQHFEGRDWEEEQLDAGLHYVRRRLRETMMMLTTADGIFKFTETPLKPKKQAEMEKFRPYVRASYLEAPTLENPVEIPLYEIWRLDYLVGKLGELKDFKESQLDLALVLAEPGMIKAEGLSLSEAKEHAFKIVLEYFDRRNKEGESKGQLAKKMTLPTEVSIEAQARKFYEYIIEAEVFESLLEKLDDGIKKLEKAAKKAKKGKDRD